MNDRKKDSVLAAGHHGDGMPWGACPSWSEAAAAGAGLGLVAFSPMGPLVPVAGVGLALGRLSLATLVDMTNDLPKLSKSCLSCLPRAPGNAPFTFQFGRPQSTPSLHLTKVFVIS